jgi:hypothetical protein
MAKQKPEAKSRLRFDLLSLKKGEQVVSAFPELANYPAFDKHGRGDNDWAARFAIFYADAGSDYRNLSIDLKRQRCLKESGAPEDNPRRAAVLAGTDPGVLALLIEYVRLQDWLEYATVFHGRELVWRILAEIAEPGNDLVDAKDEKPVKQKNATKDKTASMKYALETVEELDRRWNALFMADPELKSGAQQQVQRDKLNSESRAEQRNFIPTAKEK